MLFKRPSPLPPATGGYCPLPVPHPTCSSAHCALALCCRLPGLGSVWAGIYNPTSSPPPHHFPTSCLQMSLEDIGNKLESISYLMYR